MRIHALSIHADYRCRHSGACCTSSWPIPVERATAARLTVMLEAGRLVPHQDGRPPLVCVADAPVETPSVAATCDDGACVFYERETGLCAIHREAGPMLLPTACQQFPRVSLLDGRGLFVNLSHYCPTVAQTLFRQDVNLGVVEAPRAFPPGFPYDPLDARAALPPLLTPAVLLDLETFGRWEREVVAAFGNEEAVPEDSLASVAHFTEELCRWKAETGPLVEYFDNLITRAGGPAAPRPGARGLRSADWQRYAMVVAAIPRDYRLVRFPKRGLAHFSVTDSPGARDGVAASFRRFVEPTWLHFAGPVRRYLAAKVFGSWVAYQGRGLRTIVFSVAVALSVLKVNAAIACSAAARDLDRDLFTDAIRRSDEMLLHLASREHLARALGAIEKVAGGLCDDVP